jgi:hypothetical protein
LLISDLTTFNLVQTDSKTPRKIKKKEKHIELLLNTNSASQILMPLPHELGLKGFEN